MKFRISIWTKFSLWRSHISGADHSSRNCPESSIISISCISWHRSRIFVEVLIKQTKLLARCEYKVLWIWWKGRGGGRGVFESEGVADCVLWLSWPLQFVPDSQCGVTHTHTEVGSRFRVTAVMWFVVGKSECEIMYLKLWNTFVNLWKEKIHWICQSTAHL